MIKRCARANELSQGWVSENPACRRQKPRCRQRNPVGMTVRSDGLTGVFLGVLLVHLLHVQRQVVQERLRLVFRNSPGDGALHAVRRQLDVRAGLHAMQGQGTGHARQLALPSIATMGRPRSGGVQQLCGTSGLTCPPTPAMRDISAAPFAIQADRQVVWPTGPRWSTRSRHTPGSDVRCFAT